MPARERAFWWCYARVYDLLWDGPLTDELAEVIHDAIRSVAPDAGADVDVDVDAAGGSAAVTVLDVGAGTGLMSRRLAALGHRVVAAEPSPSMRRHLVARGRASVVVADGIDDLTAGRVDALAGAGGWLLVANVLHLTNDPGGAASRLRVAARGRPVVVVSPAEGVHLVAMARAQRAAGASPAWVARFLLLHALLVPVIVLLGPRPRHGMVDRSPGSISVEGTAMRLRGVLDVGIWPGSSALPSARI